MSNNSHSELVVELYRLVGDNCRDAEYGDAMFEAAAEIERMAGEIAALREAVKVLRDGYADAVSGYRYIIQRYGRMDGVGFDRVIDHYDQWVMIPEREGLLAGSHKLPARQALGESQ